MSVKPGQILHRRPRRDRRRRRGPVLGRRGRRRRRRRSRPRADRRRPPTRSGFPFAYSPEKEKLLAPLIREFNREGRRQAFVEGEVVASGEAESKIADGRLEPVTWSPASSLWGRLLNFDADRPLAARGQPLDRAHAARDRHVGAVRPRARLAARADRLRAGHAPGALQPGLRRVRPAPSSGSFKLRAHQPRLLHLGARPRWWPSTTRPPARRRD